MWLLQQQLLQLLLLLPTTAAADGGTPPPPQLVQQNFSGAAPARRAANVPYGAWSDAIKAGACGAAAGPAVSCALVDGVKVYRFPAGVFEIGEQLLLPERTAIVGAAAPNDMAHPTRPPDWARQTVFLATRGQTEYGSDYCHAKDMVTMRVGFVLSSHVGVFNVSYQGIDTIRPGQNGALCGGGAFETKGCAENDCAVSAVNNAGSDGRGSVGAIIDGVRLNDYYHAADAARIGAGKVPGNYNCSTGGCCFCKPNGVRATQVYPRPCTLPLRGIGVASVNPRAIVTHVHAPRQVGVWVPQTRNAEGTTGLVVRNLVSSATQADGINLHGYVRDTLVQDTYVANSGDDSYALWGAALNPSNVTFSRNVAVNTGVLRPGWYGNCFATYGLRSAPPARHPRRHGPAPPPPPEPHCAATIARIASPPSRPSVRGTPRASPAARAAGRWPSRP
jgi:hypothetical protein